MCCRRLLKHGPIYLCMLLFCGEETKSIIGYILLSFLFTLNIMYDNVNMVQCDAAGSRGQAGEEPPHQA